MLDFHLVLRKNKQLTLIYIVIAAASALPDEWVQMKDNENIKVVSLPTTDQTYTDIEQRFTTEVKTGSYAHRLNFDPNNLKVNKVNFHYFLRQNMINFISFYCCCSTASNILNSLFVI